MTPHTDRDNMPLVGRGNWRRWLRRAARKSFPASWLTAGGMRTLLGINRSHGHILDRLDQHLVVEYSLDSLIGQQLYIHGQFEKAETEFICRRLQALPGMALLDVGANIGLHSLQASGFPRTNPIFAFEPARQTFAMLARNIARNNLADRIRALPLAVGAAAGRAQFHYCSDDAYSSLKPDGRRAVQESYEVEIVTLDAWLAQAGIGPVGFIKIDVEGGEAEVLAGARETLSRQRPELLIEIYQGNRPGFSAEAFVREICACGYEAHVLKAGRPEAYVRHDDEFYNYYFSPKS